MTGLMVENRTVSTHSRPKAAAGGVLFAEIVTLVSTHSRPKAAAGVPDGYVFGDVVSTHSRPKAAADYF